MTTVAVERPWWVLAGLSLGVTVTTAFARFGYGLVLPAMQSEMGWSYAQAGWLNTANALGYLGGAVLAMVLIRRISPARLFAIGMVTTTLALLATGLSAALWWQTLWRIAAGVFGALSFANAGVLAAGLFQGDARRNALAIAIVYGCGVGVGIVLAGAALPLMLDTWGPKSWPVGWMVFGAISLCGVPLSLWAALQLRPPLQTRQDKATPVPVRRMLPEMAGYAGFGLGYFVYLTFLSAWMTEQRASAAVIALVWVVLGISICVSPFVWRRVLARYASGLPMALILTSVAIGSALPVVLPNGPVLLVSAVVFGLSFAMAPTAGTNFVRHNLPSEAWGRAMTQFTVVFSVAQIAGPYCAGLVGDLTGSIGTSLLAAAGVLLFGAALSLLQRPLQQPAQQTR